MGTEKDQKETVTKTVSAGIIVHIYGIPFKLEAPAVLSGHSANFEYVFKLGAQMGVTQLDNEITPEMLEAGWGAYMGFDQENDSSTKMIEAVYMAMRKALYGQAQE